MKEKEEEKREREGKRHTFSTGSVRQELSGVRYDLITPHGLRRVAQTYAEGAQKYEDRNWEKGQPFSALLNHARDHINEWLADELAGRKSREDHLAHACWNLMAIMHFQKTMPSMDDIGSKQSWAMVEGEATPKPPDNRERTLEGEQLPNSAWCGGCKKQFHQHEMTRHLGYFNLLCPQCEKIWNDGYQARIKDAHNLLAGRTTT